MKIHSVLYSLAPALAAALGVFAIVPASAQQRGSEETFVDLGRWVIVQDDAARACELRLTSDPQVILRFRKADGRAGILALERRTGRFFTGMVGDVTWSFDETRFAGYQAGNSYSLSAGASDVEARFRSARTLFVSHGGSQVARIDLKTSSAAFRLLKQCAEQWRYIPWYRRLESARYRDLEGPSSRPVASAPANTSRANTSSASRAGGIAPPIERPALSQPAASQALAPRPINRAGWINNADNLPWPSRGFRQGQGVLRYTLLVDDRGRAQECEINQSTGSRRFDRQACRLLMDRARFEPARRSNGQAVDGRYSASVQFAGE